MEVFLSIFEGILEQGLIYGIMALGIYITYSILDFPDLSVDGTFPLGSAVTAMLIAAGANPWLAIAAAFVAGCLAGLLTGIFHVVFGIKDLLAGIITMTGLYSVNLMLAGGKAILPIASKTTIFTAAPNTLLLIFLCALVIKMLLDLYLKTKSGLLLRAVGDNASMVTMMGKNPGKVKILGLMLCNGLAATAGSILCQQQRSFDVNSGNGMLVMGLASVIIGISIFGKLPLIKGTTVVFLGSILYKACLSIALNLNFNPNYLKLLMAFIFLAALVGNDMAKKGGKNYAKAGKH
ncbi:ABC transporter permease [Acetivibrio ethanolgignens]|uniref:ABC transporter n=1 Tax=Acetivibrio ethanolgignens TaxID=290052 RepID=A0A0V8QFN9_9FIRM|nr:ABC transporter [Acetivibrio ethanolgignens]KSV59274.1 ABC transporter [Acetivibrio ethanolgignens]